MGGDRFANHFFLSFFSLVDFRFSGDIRLDVEQLNERLEVKGAARIRHSGIAPDEAHGVSSTS